MNDTVPDWLGARLLVVDDDPVVLRSMSRVLKRAGYKVSGASGVDEAIGLSAEHPFDVALIDLALPDGSGLDVLEAVKSGDPTVECIIFTGHTSAPTAVQAYDAGAVEYFEKPITDWPRFEAVLRRAVRLRRLARESDPDEAPVAEQGAESEEALLRRELVGTSKRVSDIRGAILDLAPRHTTVALLGPTGSGKTLIAELMHRASGREGRLEVLACSALRGPGVYAELFGRVVPDADGAGRIRPGAFDRARGGTLVFDEIGDLPLELQGNLLQVLDGRGYLPQEGTDRVQPDVRVVVTSHQDLEALADTGAFRRDLLHRLGIRIAVPALREHPEDIPQFVYRFLRQVNAREGLDVRRVPAGVLERLIRHDWEGSNVRGLRTAVERAAIFSSGDELEVEALPAELREMSGLRTADPSQADSPLPDVYRGLPYSEFKERLLQDFMSLYLRDLLTRTGGNVTQAARLAGLHRPNFRRLMKRYDVDSDV